MVLIWIKNTFWYRIGGMDINQEYTGYKVGGMNINQEYTGHRIGGMDMN